MRRTVNATLLKLTSTPPNSIPL